MTDTAYPRSETILVVDDEPALRELIRVVLKMNGYRVLEAGSGQEALRILASSPAPVHLMLSDVLMPDMNGQELAEQAHQRYPETRILLISGCTGTSDFYDWATQAGVVFLSKPFNVEDLERVVREALDGYCPLYKSCDSQLHEAALSWTIP